MGWFRVYFNVGWCSMDVQAKEREEAITKVWETLNDLRHGAVEGFRLGSYTVSAQHTLDLGRPGHAGSEAHTPASPWEPQGSHAA